MLTWNTMLVKRLAMITTAAKTKRKSRNPARGLNCARGREESSTTVSESRGKNTKCILILGTCEVCLQVTRALMPICGPVADIPDAVL